MSEPQMKRSPWVAVALSLVSTGLGHVYCGWIVRGLTLFCASLLFAPLAFVLALLAPATLVLVVLLLAVAGVLGLYLFAAVDAVVDPCRRRIVHAATTTTRSCISCSAWSD